MHGGQKLVIEVSSADFAESLTHQSDASIHASTTKAPICDMSRTGEYGLEYHPEQKQDIELKVMDERECVPSSSGHRPYVGTMENDLVDHSCVVVQSPRKAKIKGEVLEGSHLEQVVK